jgi:hypothetical protein
MGVGWQEGGRGFWCRKRGRDKSGRVTHRWRRAWLIVCWPLLYGSQKTRAITLIPIIPGVSLEPRSIFDDSNVYHSRLKLRNNAIDRQLFVKSLRFDAVLKSSINIASPCRLRKTILTPFRRNSRLPLGIRSRVSPHVHLAICRDVQWLVMPQNRAPYSVWGSYLWTRDILMAITVRYRCDEIFQWIVQRFYRCEAPISNTLF